MDVTIKDVPTECVDEVKRMARVAVFRYKDRQLTKPTPDMTTFDTNNGLQRTEKARS